MTCLRLYSQIEFQMSCTKLSYLINFGKAPHFHQLLVHEQEAFFFFEIVLEMAEASTFLNEENMKVI